MGKKLPPAHAFLRNCFYFYVFSASIIFLSFSLPLISAQGNGIDESNASVMDVGRRSKIFVDKIRTGLVLEKKDPDSFNLGVDLDSGLGIFDAFFASFSLILVSEIGDETFIIAALMAMRHPKSIVLSGALSALFVMTILSTGFGRIVPNLISRRHTNSAATGCTEVHHHHHHHHHQLHINPTYIGVGTIIHAKKKVEKFYTRCPSCCNLHTKERRVY